MASLFWVGGTGTYDATTNHFATTTGGTATVAAVTAADTVTFDANSGAAATVSTTAALSCLSMTINKSDLTLSLGNTLTCATAGTLTLTSGTLNTNGQTCSWGLFNSNNANTRTLTFGASAITVTGTGTVWNITTTTGLTLNPGTSAITFTGTSPTIIAGASLTYNTISITGSGTASWNSNAVNVANFTRTGTATKTDGLTIANTSLVVTTLTLSGNSAINRLFVNSNTLGTAKTITAATVVASNVDFQDIIGAGAASWNLSAITGGSGDCFGNSGITFTTSATQTWSGTAGGNWSANAWTTRVPLPQDNVLVSSAFAASQIVTIDMPRIGRSIDWTGTTGTPTWSFATSTQLFGSLTLTAGMSTGTGSGALRFGGRSANTVTTSGVALGFTAGISLYAPGGSVTMQDALTASGQFDFNSGTWATGNFNMALSVLASNVTSTRVLNLGSSTVNLSATGAVTIWTLNASNLTLSATGATIAIANASASTRTFNGGNGNTYGTVTYTVAGSTGQLTMLGNCTIQNLNFSDATNARTLSLTAGTTFTFGNFNVSGSAGKLVTVSSATPGSAATVSKPSGTVASDYLSIQDITATGGATWYAGANSTNVSNNTGWIFTAPPSLTSSNLLLMGIG